MSPGANRRASGNSERTPLFQIAQPRLALPVRGRHGNQHHTRTRIDFLVLTGLLVRLFASSAFASDDGGTVCIAPIPTAERWDANDTGAKESSTFTTQIDRMPPVLVTTNASGVFTNLSLAGQHSVKIQLDGKPLTSFRFSFKGRGNHLRLWYNSFYGTWSLSDLRPGERCACPGAKRPTVGIPHEP